MNDDRPKRDTMSIEEATVSNMWEIAAALTEMSTHTRMVHLSMLTVLLLILSGCINISTRLQPEDVSVKALKTGSDCVPIILGFGFGTATVERAKAQLEAPDFGDPPPSDGPITKVRRVESTDFQVLFFGNRCVEVTGE